MKKNSYTTVLRMLGALSASSAMILSPLAISARQNSDSDSQFQACVADSTACDQQESIHSFIEAVSVADNFDVYAEEMTTDTHIDGNVALKTLTGKEGGEVEDIKLQNHDPMSTRYSYIEDMNGSGFAVMDGAVVIASNVGTIGNMNTISDERCPILITLDGSLSEVSEQRSDVYAFENGLDPESEAIIASLITPELMQAEEVLEQLKQEMQISDNLQEIAAAGQQLIDSSSTIASSQKPFEQVITLLNESELAAGDILMLNVSSDVFSKDAVESGLQNGFATIFMKNQETGATFIINVDTSGNPTDLYLAVPMNSSTDNPDKPGLYGDYSNYIWNFGDYEGIIHAQQQVTGTVVAPSAHYDGRAVLNGNLIAKTVYQSMEFHQSNNRHDTTDINHSTI